MLQNQTRPETCPNCVATTNSGTQSLVGTASGSRRTPYQTKEEEEEEDEEELQLDKARQTVFRKW